MQITISILLFFFTYILRKVKKTNSIVLYAWDIYIPLIIDIRVFNMCMNVAMCVACNICNVTALVSIILYFKKCKHRITKKCVFCPIVSKLC